MHPNDKKPTSDTDEKARIIDSESGHRTSYSSIAQPDEKKENEILATLRKYCPVVATFMSCYEGLIDDVRTTDRARLRKLGKIVKLFFANFPMLTPVRRTKMW